MKIKLYILFVACLSLWGMIAGASLTGCDNVLAPASNQPNVIYTLDSLTVQTNDTGSVYVSKYQEWLANDSNVTITFTGEVTSSGPNDVKYLSITTMRNNAVNFEYTKYNDAINGSHTLTVSNHFDILIFYIKIFTNYSPGLQFIKLRNIRVTKC